MRSGEACRLSCADGYSSSGLFACAWEGQLLGDARCVPDGESTGYATMVAGALQCSLDVSMLPGWSTSSTNALSDIFKEALASTLQLPVEAVLRVLVSLIDSRRLSDYERFRRRLGNELYSVMYELGANQSSQAAQLAQRLAEIGAGGQEQENFMQILADNHNITLQQIDVLVAPRVFLGGEAPSPAPRTTTLTPTEEATDVLPILGAVMGVISGIIFVWFGSKFARRMRRLVDLHCNS